MSAGARNHCEGSVAPSLLLIQKTKTNEYDVLFDKVQNIQIC
jgi:hypothetical protein